jgi:hypothetical protein
MQQAGKLGLREGLQEWPGGNFRFAPDDQGRLDLRTDAITLVHGSQLLRSRRWSPDGRSIAALDTTQNALLIYSFANVSRVTTASGLSTPGPASPTTTRRFSCALSAWSRSMP